jgi:hypothetical protein
MPLKEKGERERERERERAKPAQQKATMGCNSSLPVADTALPPLPNGIVRVNSVSPKELMDEFSTVTSLSFSGDVDHAPEGNLSWCFDPASSIDDDPCKALKDGEFLFFSISLNYTHTFRCLHLTSALLSFPSSRIVPSQERKDTFDFIVRWCMFICLRHGSCFALRKEGKIVSTALCCPPSDRRLHELGMCGEMAAMNACAPIPKSMTQVCGALLLFLSLSLCIYIHAYIYTYTSRIHL